MNMRDSMLQGLDNAVAGAPFIHMANYNPSM